MCQAHRCDIRVRLSALVMAGISLFCIACSTAGRRADQLARAGALTPRILQGADFQHQLYARLEATGDTLLVFIDGDGVAYTNGGTAVSTDPTPHRALALELAAETPGPVVYLGRPCSFSVRADPACSPDDWTSSRYSAAVATSMARAVARYAGERFQRLVLVGYSGGGTLAVLMAAQLGRTAAVITIAANLDTDAWTQWHGYLPLTGSLNPSDMAPLPSSIPQWHLVGDRDTNTPARLNARYWATVAPDRIWHYAQFDHVCCWAEHWPAIFARIQAERGP